MAMNDELAVILFGDLSDGYTSVGPFKSADEAFEWLDKNNMDHWPIGWVMPMIPPKEFVDHMKTHEEVDDEEEMISEKEGSKNDN